MTTKGIAQGGTQGGKEVTTKPDDKKGVRLKTAKGGSTWYRFRRRFMRHKPAVMGVIVLAILVLGAIFAHLAALGVDPYAVDFASINHAPVSGHFLGTDGIGRDMWARLVYGARISLSIGLVVVSINTAIAIVIGGISGYFGGLVDNLLQRFTEAVMLFPSFILIITVTSFLKPSIYNVMIVLGIFGWPGTSRVVRAMFLSIRETDYVLAAQASGVRWPGLIFKHILPGTLAPLIVSGTLGLVGAIMTESTLSFLGLGVQEPIPSWGSMLQNAMQLPVLRGMWWRWIPPAALISITAIAVNFIGDGLRDAADPHTLDG
jgi:peptide/nickel transport system permease protein